MTTHPQAPFVRSFVLGPYETNCYIVRPREDATHCWIIDASFDPEPLVSELQRSRAEPRALILTHAHPDHIAGVADVRRAFPRVPILIHEAEAGWLTDPMLNLSALLGVPITAPTADRLLRHGEQLELDGTRWEVRHTPGHSPGGITLVLHGGTALQSGHGGAALQSGQGGAALQSGQGGTALQSGQGGAAGHRSLSPAGPALAFAGDTLFDGSIGRTDFPGSDHATLLRSIRTQLYTLPDETRIYPGHGPPTTIGKEKRSNPFVRAG